MTFRSSKQLAPWKGTSGALFCSGVSLELNSECRRDAAVVQEVSTLPVRRCTQGFGGLGRSLRTCGRATGERCRGGGLVEDRMEPLRLSAWMRSRVVIVAILPYGKGED